MNFDKLTRVLVTATLMFAIIFSAVRCSEPSNGATATAPDATNVATGSPIPSFNYTPIAPVNGTKKGVVEVGTSGFNSFIITIDSLKNWKLDKAEYAKSLMKEGSSSPAVIREGLKTYIADMKANGVSDKNIHFLISSGAKKEAKADKIIATLKSLGYVVNVVNADQEGEMGFKVAVPKPYQDKTYMVDIGSGNTKITWLQDGKLRTREAQGAKYSQDSIADETVFQDVLTKVGQVPDAQRGICFIIGGVPSQMAKQARKGEERFTTVQTSETFTPENDKQRCGLNIFKAIQKGSATNRFIFDWEANFSIGFLLDLK